MHNKVLPGKTKLDRVERTMKKLLLHWIGGWMHILALTLLITASWRMCLDAVAMEVSVDEIQTLRGVICLEPAV